MGGVVVPPAVETDTFHHSLLHPQQSQLPSKLPKPALCIHGAVGVPVMEHKVILPTRQSLQFLQKISKGKVHHPLAAIFRQLQSVQQVPAVAYMDAVISDVPSLKGLNLPSPQAAHHSQLVRHTGLVVLPGPGKQGAGHLGRQNQSFR